ncbi:MAG: asparagine synthase (glutamine-hydrolyzing) [Deltaproteobacteria bacterium]|nr:MAG: asparagine synthase (glutamine-hydrolyzing) [Deltaproteobacteria bacterium]
MCGICGIYNFGTSEPVNKELLHEMNQTLLHRGPDDEGVLVDGNFGMAMRRLAIIDLASGKQPIHNEDKSIWTVFNGEIYNYKELRQLLEKKGHKFYTSSDTETIVHLYEDYGEGCLAHLRGMYAIAIWDSKRKTLFLSRDRLGVKPLFYSIINNEKIVFASEIKAILRYPSISREMDYQALDAYFAYLYIPAPLTIYKGINKLNPGHFIKINEKDIVIKKYWDVRLEPDFGKPEKYFLDGFLELFREAVKSRLISEVPLGGFLSGGVDSSMVVSQMALNVEDAVNAFTVGFSGNIGAYLDERPYAKLVAEKYDLNYEMIEVEPNVESVLDSLTDAFDEPFADDSVIPSFYICKAAKKKVTVVLTGLGGDELFAGYERYLGFRLSMLYDYVPMFLTRSIIQPSIRLLPESKNGTNTINHIKRFIHASTLPLKERYASYVTTMDMFDRAKLYTKGVANKIHFEHTLDLVSSHYNSDNTSTDPLDRALYQDFKTYLPEDILALTDRIGMHHSLELRVPFTDHKLVEFCVTIPSKYKIRWLEKKFLLKKAALKYLPKEVIYHRKQGFSSPMATWLQQDLKSFCNHILSKQEIDKYGILNWNFVDRILKEHIRLQDRHDKLIFAIIMFQKWVKKAECVF